MKFYIKDFFSNVTKSVVSCGFGHIYWRDPEKKLHFMYIESVKCQVLWMWDEHFEVHKRKKSLKVQMV